MLELFRFPDSVGWEEPTAADWLGLVLAVVLLGTSFGVGGRQKL